MVLIISSLDSMKTADGVFWILKVPLKVIALDAH